MDTQIKSVKEVIELLGGPTAVGKLLNLKPNVVSNWNKRRFPPETYVVLARILAEKGFSAPASLWKMRKPSIAAE